MSENNYKYKYEIVTSDANLPGKVMLYDKIGPECFTNKHWHKNVELNYIINGTMWAMAGTKNYDLTNDDLLLINSEEVHQTCGKYNDENVKYLVLLFSYSYIKAYFPDFEDYYFDIEQNEQYKNEIKNILKEIVYEYETKNKFYEIKIACAMTQILTILFTKCRVKCEGNSYKKQFEDLEYAKKAIDFIKEHYREKIGLDDIAAYVGLTPTYFSRYFKQSTRKTFKQYLNLVRLENALSSIQAKGISETRAALENGFPSVKAFISAFKSVYNCTPSEYSKKYHELPYISEIRKI